MLELLKVGLGPLFALGERQRRIAKGGGEIERIAGADPGDVMRAQRDQLLNAGHRVGGGGGRQRADLCEAVGTGKLGLIVAADGQCDEIARTKSLAAGRKGRDLLGKSRQPGNHIGIAGLRAADRVVRQRRQIVGGLQRVHEVRAAAEAAGRIGRRAGGAGKAEQAESASRCRPGIGVTVTKAGD